MGDELGIIFYVANVFILTTLCAAYIIRNENFDMNQVYEVLILFAGIVIISFGIVFLFNALFY